MGKLTRKEIAEVAGVSPSTVSRALSGSRLLPKETIERIRAIAAEMGYQPNSLARQLAMNRSMRIGYVLPHRTTRKGPLQVAYFSVILDAMVAKAAELGYEISILTYDEEDELTAARLADGVKARRVDALVVVGLRQQSRLVVELVRHKLPFVLLDTQSDLNGIGQILCDPRPAHDEMLAILAKKECERLFFVSGDMGYFHAASQRKTLISAMENNKDKIVLNEEITGNYTRKSGYLAAERILESCKSGDCVFLSNDRMAAGFYRYCHEHGVSIPDRIRVIGSDDDEAASMLYPNLTTIYQPRVEMGEAAVEMAVDMLNGGEPTTVILPKRFIMGKSI